MLSLSPAVRVFVASEPLDMRGSFDVIGLGGYHDKAYLHLAGGCIYKDKDIDALESAAAAADDPVVLLTHGPLRQKGQQAIDYVPGADNVGDARLTALVKKAKISFGISGHFLEAAGHGTDVAGKPRLRRRRTLSSS